MYIIIFVAGLSINEIAHRRRIAEGLTSVWLFLALLANAKVLSFRLKFTLSLNGFQ